MALTFNELRQEVLNLSPAQQDELLMLIEQTQYPVDPQEDAEMRQLVDQSRKDKAQGREVLLDGWDSLARLRAKSEAAKAHS